MTRIAEYSATLLMALAVVHTFLTGPIREFSHRFGKKTLSYRVLHLLSEVEAVFGIWAIVFFFLSLGLSGTEPTLTYFKSIDLNEPLFVFAVMAVSATRAIRELAIGGILFLTRVLRKVFPFLSPTEVFYFVALGIAPLLGSVITEPAVMTVLAIILLDGLFLKSQSLKLKYTTLAVLFVNVSIGGTLTHFAAPPVVMVAKAWGWDTPYLFSHFGIKAAIAALVNAFLALHFLRKDLKAVKMDSAQLKKKRIPLPVTLIHGAFVFLVVWYAHHPAIFLPLLLVFLFFTRQSSAYQDPIAWKESALVGSFLAGLVVLGKPQAWWLSPLLQSMSENPLFIGTTLLTAITDNAALTYLGSQVQGLSESMKIALLEGAVTGGGLTVIANAPNPAGFGILKSAFPDETVNPIRLFLAAFVPTLIAAIVFRFF